MGTKLLRRRDPMENVKKYRNYCKKFIFIEGDTINVKVNEKFAYESSVNHTIPTSPKKNKNYKKIEILEGYTIDLSPEDSTTPPENLNAPENMKEPEINKGPEIIKEPENIKEPEIIKEPEDWNEPEEEDEPKNPDQIPEEIEKVETRSFYPYESGHCGGYTHYIDVYRAKKKGTYKMVIDSTEINVIVN